MSAWSSLASTAKVVPKSMSRTCPSLVSTMFSGLISEWHMPCALGLGLGLGEWHMPCACRSTTVSTVTVAYYM